MHHEWPIDGAALAHDGEAGWSVRWAKPNRPDQMARVHYYFLFLPWLSQDAEVSLARTKNETLREDHRESLGHHAAIGVSLDAEWSPELLEAPDGATVTTGS